MAHFPDIGIPGGMTKASENGTGSNQYRAVAGKGKPRPALAMQVPPLTQQAAAQLDGLPPDLRDKLWAETNRWVAHQGPAPQFTEPELQTLAQTPNRLGRTIAACNLHNTALLEQLAADNDPDIRAGVAENPSTPLPTLLRMLDREDTTPDIRMRAGRRRDLPEPLIRQLAQDPDTHVRQSIAGNPSTPPDVLEHLAQDSRFEVRIDVAWNRSTPSGVLTQLAADRVRPVQMRVAGNRNTPVEALEHLSHSLDSLVRSAVAKHPRLPAEAIQRLSADKDGLVRLTIAGRRDQQRTAPAS